MLPISVAIPKLEANKRIPSRILFLGNYNEKSSCKERHAIVTCFLKDKLSGTIYGLTNLHAMIHASEGIFIKSRGGDPIFLGSPWFPRCQNTIDICLFEIQIPQGMKLCNEVQRSKALVDMGVQQHVQFYRESLVNLFQQRVFKHRANEDTSNLFVIHHGSSEQGVIEMIRHLKNESSSFFVKGISSTFAFPGESGTAVAINDEGTIKLVGVIIGEETNASAIGCFFMPFVIEKLKDYYGFTPELYFEENQQRLNDSDVIAIEPGTVIFFVNTNTLVKRPEKISPNEFTLCDRTMMLIENEFDDSTMDFATFIEQENVLKRLVNDRKTLVGCAIFTNDSPDYVTMENGLQACDALYSGQVDIARKKLKVALRAVVPAKGIGFRQFAKLITYVTWYLLYKDTTESLKNMQEILDAGLKFLKRNESFNTFPHDARMYLCYDYSRYYQSKLQKAINLVEGVSERTHRTNYYFRQRDIQRYRQKRIKMMKNAEQIAKGIYRLNPSQESFTRLILMQAEYAFTLLGSGMIFKAKSSVTHTLVSKDDLVQAEDVLTEIKRNKAFAIPFVQYTVYRLAKCDFLFCKDDLHQALKLAEICHKEAVEAKYENAIDEFNCRIEKLKNTSKQINIETYSVDGFFEKNG